MAMRLDFFFKQEDANPTLPPLVTNYYPGGEQDLSESGDEEESNDEESEDGEGAGGDADSLVAPFTTSVESPGALRMPANIFFKSGNE
jgi:hypothetical protein